MKHENGTKLGGPIFKGISRFYALLFSVLKAAGACRDSKTDFQTIMQLYPVMDCHRLSWIVMLPISLIKHCHVLMIIKDFIFI